VPEAVVIDAAFDALEVCARVQVAAHTVPPLEGATFHWRSSNSSLLSVDSLGNAIAHAPGSVTISAMWTQDTLLHASHDLSVVSIGPSAVALAGIRNSETGVPVQPSNLRSRVAVLVQLFVYAYFSGEVELLIDGNVLAQAPYPTGCPQRIESVTLPLDAGALAGGSHWLEVRVISEGQVVSRDGLAVTVVNQGRTSSS